MSVEKGKTYRTRSGLEVTIYATGLPNTVHCVHGAVLHEGEWKMECWTRDGRYSTLSGVEAALDLIEFKPRIRREVWVNVYSGSISPYPTKAQAYNARNRGTCLACIPLTIDCEEGDGL